MRFSGKQAFLVLERVPADGERVARISGARSAIFSSWNHSTRISPLFILDDIPCESPEDEKFTGNTFLLFLGPVHPERVLPYCSEVTKLWLSLGAYNIVLATSEKKALDSVNAWADSRKIPREFWRLMDGVLKEIVPHNIPEGACNWNAAIQHISDSDYLNETNDAVQDYCAAMSSAFARGSLIGNGLVSELTATHAVVEAEIKQSGENDDGTTIYRVLGRLLTVNAALTRFVDQAFSGTSPICETESYLRSHSLLGLGTAISALINLRKFIESTLGKAHIPHRFAALKEITTKVPDLQREDPSDDDILGAMAHPPNEDLVPLLTYFSARDGYRATETTLSTPMASISCCNSPRWSLRTLTHEISHLIIRAVLTDLYPNLGKQDELVQCDSLLQARKEPANNLFDEIRRYFLISICMMDRAILDPLIGKEGDVILSCLLQRWRHDVEETMVHCFDFLYFYGQSVDDYISGIWASWGTIPNISTRVDDYVIRSLTAVLSVHLRHGNRAEDIAKDRVLDSLRGLQKKQLGGLYVQQAIAFIEQSWVEIIKPKVLARRPLAKIVRHYLFSEQIATRIRGERGIVSGAYEREGYDLRRLCLDYHPIDNPLRFMEFYTENAPPNAIHSAWILYTLAFCVSPP